MAFKERAQATTYEPQDGDTLETIAERENADGNPLTGDQIARFNWGTDDPDDVDRFLRDRLCCVARGEDKRFLITADIEPTEDLLIPQTFKAEDLALDRMHRIRVRRPTEPPHQFEGCARIDGVTFDFDLSFIRPSVVGDLKKLEQVIGDHPDAKILIFGHTDKVGPPEYNKKLSERRAKSVFAFITNQPDTWNDLYDEEDWGLGKVQVILEDLGHDPGPIDGIMGPKTRDGMRSFLGAGPGAPVQNDAAFRRQLFLAYMTGKHDIDIDESQFMDPRFMGCGEFNPLHWVEGRNEANRRVVFFLFNPERLPTIPCLRFDQDSANFLKPCRDRGATETQPSPPLPRWRADFTCSLYDSLAKDCGDESGLVVQPPAPAISVSITDPCRFVPHGKTCTFEASGTPGGGTYSWSASGGVSISGASNASTVEVRGDTVSGAIDAAQLTVTYSDGSNSATEAVGLTVFEITEIKVTVKPTPPNTVRPGFPAPADLDVTIASDSTSFATNEPVVLMRCPNRKVELEATARPANLPLNWHRERNAADHATLGGAGDLPTVTPDGADRTKAELTLDQKGSFHIRPFVACKGDDTFHADHAPRCLNLVLAEATVVRDRSAANGANLSVNRQNTSLRIVNGAWGPAPLSAATLANAGMAMELVSDVTGGGADGRLGLDQVFCGLINNVLIRNVFFHYRDTTAAPPTNHRIRLIAVSNPGAATGAHAAWGSFFQAGDPAPVLHALPLLDSGLNPAGVGADTALMTRSQADPSTRVNRPVGQRWTTRCIDSPGTPMPRNHLGNANAVMNHIDYQYQFKAAFCFWTNRSKSRGQTNDLAERTYSVLRLYDWEIRGVWDVTAWPAAAPATLNATTAHTIRQFNQATAAPLERAQQDRSVEVRPPSGISAGLSRDAQ